MAGEGPRSFGWLRGVALRAALLALAVWLLLLVTVVVGGLVETDCDPSAIVVLGNEAHPDGSPSNRLRARLDRAMAIHDEFPDAVLLVSGGVDAHDTDESAVMKGYLVRRGVPADRVMTDSLGLNTASSAANARSLLDPRRHASILLVSQYFHLSRARYVFRGVGYRAVCSRYPRFVELRDVYSVLGETAALLYYWVTY